MHEPETTSLPENAYRPLKPGETYTPIVQATMHAPELTARAILWGVFFCVIFTVASALSSAFIGFCFHQHSGFERRKKEFFFCCSSVRIHWRSSHISLST